MALAQTIYRRLFGGPSLDRLPFEELVEWYPSKPAEVFEEFVRRMRVLVFQAVLDFVKRTCPGASLAEMEKLVMNVFEDFAPQFSSGKSSMILVDFAKAIRRVLDSEAFESISQRYYYQIPIYYVKDDQERQFLAAMYQKGIGPSIDEEMAERFLVTLEEARRIIKRANQSLKRVVSRDFTEKELNQATEGCVTKDD